ncbi:aquaporin family protein [Peribacillus simplex]|uniref:MIP/aquaporin family protein n=1 Tax=Peribacillus simplex TaxID=1478 RepID=UPI0010BF1938|nr:MIP/aquaporin family protein [Peribacillus simplex]TKH03460.1 aquaporin family protein [Peribacillus simplex]
MTPFLGEMVGAMILMILVGGVAAGVLLNKSKAQNSGWIVITLGAGLAVTIAIYIAGGISGGHLNPAVTLSFATIGLFPWSQVPIYIFGQMIGAILGSTVVFLLYYPHWEVTENPDLKLAVFSTSPAISNPFANLLSEMIGTFVLVFGVLGIGANKFTEGLNPLIIGLFIVSIGLSLGGPTGFAINPARDLGPRIAHFILPISGKGSSNWKYAWIPVVGPLIGGVGGAIFYKGLFKGNASLAILELCVVLFVCIVIILFLQNKRSEKYSKDQTKIA